MKYLQTIQLVGTFALVAMVLLASGCGGSTSSKDTDSKGVFDRAELDD